MTERLEEEVCKWEAAIEAIMSGSSRTDERFTGQSAACFSAPSTSTEGVFGRKQSKQNITATRTGFPTVNVVVSRRKSAATDEVDESSGQSGSEVQASAVIEADLVDDQSMIITDSAEDVDVIHVVNDKKCLDSSEIKSGTDCFDPENLRLAQEADADIAPVLHWKNMYSDRPSWNEVAKYSETAKNYCSQWNSLAIVDGIL